MLRLPRTVGTDPASGEEIQALNGRFGPYVKKGTDTRSLETEEQLLSVTLDEALALVRAAQDAPRSSRRPRPLRELGEDPETSSPVVVRSGRFGPYVTDGTTNASLRKGDEPETITIERAAELLADRRAAGPPVKRAGRATKASKSAKKTAKTAKKAQRPRRQPPPRRQGPPRRRDRQEGRHREEGVEGDAHGVSGRGRLIALEGVDGCGKSTQAVLLAGAIGALSTAEPGATQLGATLRALALDPGLPPVSERAEALLMAADRSQHVVEVVRPALERGQWVVTERFSGSTLAYQGYGRGLDLDELRRLVSWASEGIDAGSHDPPRCPPGARPWPARPGTRRPTRTSRRRLPRQGARRIPRPRRGRPRHVGRRRRHRYGRCRGRAAPGGGGRAAGAAPRLGSTRCRPVSPRLGAGRHNGPMRPPTQPVKSA